MCHPRFKLHPRLPVPALIAFVLLTACQGQPVSAPANQSTATRELREGYGLLHDLLTKQRHVDKLLLIRAESDGTEKIIKAIARTCGDAADQLEQWAKQTDVVATQPPRGLTIDDEVRVSIETETRNQLLTGGLFELNLLLSQVRGMQYGSHLARRIAEHETDQARAEWLRRLAEQLNVHQQTLMARLKA